MILHRMHRPYSIHLVFMIYHFLETFNRRFSGYKSPGPLACTAQNAVQCKCHEGGQNIHRVLA